MMRDLGPFRPLVFLLRLFTIQTYPASKLLQLQRLIEERVR